ncbi:MAG: hypothetical protein GDA49_01925 [Rhodospirillales bacterium]|nr:hypothetical protein [Rhodospirillales bacterium]
MNLALAGSLIGPISNLIDDLFTSDEERAAAKQRLLELQQKGGFAKAEQQLSVILAEAQSQDPWTSRARPTLFYLMYSVIALCFIGGVAGIW